MQKAEDRNPAWEYPDPRPVALPVGFKAPTPLEVMVRQIVRTTVSQAAGDSGRETFEEADDFDVEEEDGEMHSPWELNFDKDENLMKDRHQYQEYQKNRKMEMEKYKRDKESFDQEKAAWDAAHPKS